MRARMNAAGWSWVVGALLAAPAVGAGFDADTATGDGGTTQVNCNAITGSAGLVTDWTHTTPTSKSLKSANGEVGAVWDGNSPEFCAMLNPSVSETSTCFHRYKRTGGAGNDFHINLSSETVIAGEATWIDDTTDWWWLPQVDVRDTKPTVTLLKADGTTYGTATWTETNAFEQVWRIGTGGLAPPGGTKTPGAAVGTTGGGMPPAPPTGSMVGTTGTIASNNAVKSVRIDYVTQTVANRTADNASVTGWKVVIKSTMTTSAN